MDIQNLVPVDFANQRVLLSAQVAQVFECDLDRIRDNFHSHKEQFEEGVHYFKVTGDALRLLKRQVAINDAAHTPLIHKFASAIYLWTEQGAMLHCKLVDTDAAWKMLKDLITFYFAHRDDTPVQQALEFTKADDDIPFNKRFSIHARNAEARDFKAFKKAQRESAQPVIEPPLIEQPTAIVPPQPDWERLLELAEKFHDPQLRDKVLIHVINNLCGQNIF